MVEGMPQLRLHARQPQRHGQDNLDHPAYMYGMDGAADFDHEGPAGGQSTWRSAVSSPNANNNVNSDVQIIPPRSHWPYTDHPNAPSNPGFGSRSQQQGQRETVHVFLDRSSRQSGGSDAQANQHSTATDWEDIYTGGQGWFWDKRTRRYRYVKTAKPKTEGKFSRYVVAVSRFINTKEEVKLLYHARPALSARLREEETLEAKNTTLIFELKAVIGYTNEHFGHVVTDPDAVPVNYITFEHLWTLLPPNTLAYIKDKLNQAKKYRVKSSVYRKYMDGTEEFPLSVHYLDSDDHQTDYLGRQPLKIKSFQGSAPIARPPPSGVQGHALQERKPQFRGAEEMTAIFNSHGRVVLNRTSFEALDPNSSLAPLGNKKRGAFAASKIGEIKWSDTIIDSLVLNPGRKASIRALILKHGLKESATEAFDNFVSGKGRGLMGGLSGPPGVGITLTAEAVAGIARRPIYMISSGKLGGSPVSVQTNLARVSELSEAWNAVVHLDEADALLHQRTSDNLSRNAITSIFLRHLDLDDSFQSRIRFTFEDQQLDESAEEDLFKQHRPSPIVAVSSPF
ncbi:hypothetical protein N657DRAFT_681412 [Parathielavia appendiculata]|uniref:Uncharacterized protein n=1 Tax=Parathielavia appendiculata TaxID=2587402 RepID=A0AAN6TYX6_9PEZI|nr:hypothetical protein N657DRAFT_681412 [Parathielavia appendiculata]